MERRPCGIPGNRHVCVVLEAALKKWSRTSGPSGKTRLGEGVKRVLADIETGLWIAAGTSQVIGSNNQGGWRIDITYTLKRMGMSRRRRRRISIVVELGED